MYFLSNYNLYTIFIVVFIILYILETLAVIRLSMHTGVGISRYLAWIPSFNIYFTVKLGFGGLLAFISFVLNILTIPYSLKLGNTILSTNFVTENIKQILDIILAIILLLSVLRIYRFYSKHYILLSILSILSFGLLIPIFLFSIRNIKKPVPNIKDINTNAKVYIDIEKEKNKTNDVLNDKTNKRNVHVEEEYDMDNYWSGPK